MSVTIGSDDLVPLTWTGVTTWDPTDSTVTIEIDGTPHATTWAGAATQAGATWTRVCQTVHRFRGVDRTDSAPVVALAAGRHAAKVIYALADGQVVGTLPMTVAVLPSST